MGTVIESKREQEKRLRQMQMPTASIMRDVTQLDKIYPPRDTIMRNTVKAMKAAGLTLVYRDLPEEPKDKLGRTSTT